VQQSQRYPYSAAQTQPVTRTVTRTVQTTPGPARDNDLYGGPADQGRYERECETVRRETRLPDGSIVREPVEVCKTDDGRWTLPDPTTRY